MKNFVSLFVLFFCITTLLSAQNLTVSSYSQDINFRSALQEKLSAFEIVELNFTDLPAGETTNNKFESRLKIGDIIDENVVWLERNLLAPNYIATISNGEDRELIAPPITRNLIVKDAAADRQLGRLNVRNGKLSGLFFINGESWYLKPVSEIARNENTDLYVLYNAENATTESSEALCDAAHHRVASHRVAPQSSNAMSMTPCYVFEVATEADYELYQKYSSDPNETLQRVIDQFNIVEGIYLNSGIPLSFALVYQNVWTSVADPYVEGERCAMRDEFKAVWNDAGNGFTGIHRDVSYMVSGKVGTNGGCATANAGNQTLAYAVGQEFGSDTDQHLIAHELGHTLSAGHDTGADCTGDKPTSGTMCSYVGTQGFSNTSVTTITDYLNNNSGLFTITADRTIIVLAQITDIRSYIATSTLSLEADIANPGTVRAVAGRRITLPVGFWARSGSFFKASINPDMDSCN